MEASTNNRLPFIGMEIIKIDHRIETCVYQKCKIKSLLRNILHRTRRLSSTSNFFFQEYNNLNGIFLKLRYPMKLINSTIYNFQHSSDPCQPPLAHTSDSPYVSLSRSNIIKSAEVVRRRLRDLEGKINQDQEPLFTNKKIIDCVKLKELRPPALSQ